jgi:hypothetical protein
MVGKSCAEGVGMPLGNGAYERRLVAASGLVVLQYLCRAEGAVVDVVKADQTK